MLPIQLTETSLAAFNEQFERTDGCWIWQGSRDQKGYGHMRSNGKMLKAHRISFAAHHGEPGDMLVDHICHNASCVNPEHLRLVDHKQNGENRSGLQSNNASGVQGVYWHETKQHWHARVQHHRRRINVGAFRTLAEAEAAVVAKRLELFTHNELDRAS